MLRCRCTAIMPRTPGSDSRVWGIPVIGELRRTACINVSRSRQIASCVTDGASGDDHSTGRTSERTFFQSGISPARFKTGASRRFAAWARNPRRRCTATMAQARRPLALRRTVGSRPTPSSTFAIQAASRRRRSLAADRGSAPRRTCLERIPACPEERPGRRHRRPAPSAGPGLNNRRAARSDGGRCNSPVPRNRPCTARRCRRPRCARR